MTAAFVPSRETASIRNRLSHPVIDADGHLIEFMPMVFDIVGEIAGPKTAQAFSDGFNKGPGLHSNSGRQVRRARTGYWSLPTANTLDRATCALPRLMYERLDEMGIDFALLYPTFGLGPTGAVGREWRQIMARAFNCYYARHYVDFRDRLEPVAVIPTFTPDEAIEELDHAVSELGLKSVVMGTVIPRTQNPDGEECEPWIDTLGHDSLYDYTPVWEKCAELGVSPTFHGTSQYVGFRVSTKNYVYNHLGNFAAAQEAACRSLFMGGVPKRLPGLAFGFLEGGISWGAQLYADLLSHFDKRNHAAVTQFDPRRLDIDQYRRLFEEFSDDAFRPLADRIEEDLFNPISSLETDPDTTDDFAESGIEQPEDIVRIFTRQYFFGCEADDALNAVAFNQQLIPHGVRMNAMFASDIGHWDVPDMREVLPEAWEAVEDGLMDEHDFRAFTCDNAAAMLTTTNADYFAGTIIGGRI